MAETIKKPIFKEVYFDLPFLIFVKDGFRDKQLEEWVDRYLKGGTDLPSSRYAPNINHSTMTIGAALPVYIPPEELAPPYIIKVRDCKVGLRFLKRINPIHASSGFVCCGEVPGDRTGRVSFSSVSVMFDLVPYTSDSDRWEELTWEMPMFVDYSLTAVNKFIEHYRVVSNRFYIRQITAQIIGSFHLFTRFDDGTYINQIFSTGSGPMHGFGGSIEDDQDAELRAYLKKEEDAALLKVLDLEITDKLDVNEWRLAVIETELLFETWLSNFIREIMRREKKSIEEIESKFRGSSGRPLDITNIAKKLLCDTSGYNFYDTQYFRNWSMYCRDLRNDIVHGKKFLISGEEAHRAYISVKEAVMEIIGQTGIGYPEYYKKLFCSMDILWS